jgi:hypothetical protein
MRELAGRTHAMPVIVVTLYPSKFVESTIRKPVRIKLGLLLLFGFRAERRHGSSFIGRLPLAGLSA